VTYELQTLHINTTLHNEPQRWNYLDYDGVARLGAHAHGVGVDRHDTRQWPINEHVVGCEV
jgi:hypothetical protein